MTDEFTFRSLIDMWQDRYQKARPGVEVMDVRKSDEYNKKRTDIENEHRVLEPLSDRFLDLVLGREHGETVTEQAASAALCFFPRVLGVVTVDDYPAPLADRIVASVRDTFFLGMACHLLAQNHPSRSQIGEIDVDALFEEYLKESVSANSKMGAYNRAVNNIPVDIFNVQYAGLEPMIKNDLRVGFWKQGKARSNYDNTFYSGILLPVMAEVMANELR